MIFRESYVISGLSSLKLEDYEQEGDHFMPNSQHKRFKVWYGGSGGWGFDTIEEARAFAHEYAVSRIESYIREFQSKLDIVTCSKEQLGSDVFYLGSFLESKILTNVSETK